MPTHSVGIPLPQVLTCSPGLPEGLGQCWWGRSLFHGARPRCLLGRLPWGQSGPSTPGSIKHFPAFSSRNIQGLRFYIWSLTLISS